VVLLAYDRLLADGFVISNWRDSFSGAEALTAAKWVSDLHSASLEQKTLANFIAGGMYERHLRQLRKKNTARRSALLESIAKYLGIAWR
jgi:DNA-binding transcriptional MocR family regulator